MSQQIQQIKNIDLNFKNFHLKVSELEIPSRGITLIQGESGSGKTTFLRVLMGLEKSSLIWNFNSQNIAELSVSERHLGVVFQGAELFPHMTVEENILFHARARRIPSKIYLKKLKHYVQIAKIEKILKQKAQSLSGGERQRVALLRALIGNPRVLLLDEPFAALDANLKKELKSFVRQIVQEEEKPCLIVSHDEKDADDLADFVIIFYEGRIVKTYTVTTQNKE